MNAYNQETDTATDSSPRIATTINRYKDQNSDNNTYRLLVKKYSSDLQNAILDILQKDKRMSEREASDFTNNMFSLGDKRQKDMSDEIEDCYNRGKTLKQCANQIIDKYYKITKVNKYHNTTRYQTNRELSGEGEVTEVEESVKDLMIPKSTNDMIKSLGNLSIDKILIKGSTMGSDSLVNYALDNGADVHYNNDEAVRMASHEGNTEIVQLLIDNGADVNVYEGLPLVLASTNNHTETVKLLKKYMNKELNYLKKYSKTNESVRDLMTPKSKDDIRQALDKVKDSDKRHKLFYLNGMIGSDEAFIDFLEKNLDQKEIDYLKKRLKSRYIIPYDILYALTDKQVDKVINLILQENEINEKVKYEQFKLVSLSLFWNFVDRINDLGLKFQFDISYVKNVPNSLNTMGYVLYMETAKINNREVEYEFKHSKMLSTILTYILGKESENETRFYIGFDAKAQLHFGFIINNKRYKIGYTKFNSYTFQKLIPHITGNKDVDLIKLSRKFVTNIESLSSIRTILDLHLQSYEEDIEIYDG